MNRSTESVIRMQLYRYIRRYWNAIELSVSYVLRPLVMKVEGQVSDTLGLLQTISSVSKGDLLHTLQPRMAPTIPTRRNLNRNTKTLTKWSMEIEEDRNT